MHKSPNQRVLFAILKIRKFIAETEFQFSNQIKIFEKRGGAKYIIFKYLVL